MNYLTCVSCYWNVKNKYNNKYIDWFKNTLAINCPYVVFSDKEGIQLIKHFRQDLPTYYIECEIKDFYTFKYANKMQIHNVHCPSIELNLIWNEKIFMVQKAATLNPFNSEWFKWIDAGTCVYRNYPPSNIPFPNIHKLNTLPKNKFIYSSSNEINNNLITTTNYYHYISGTSYILHKNIINEFTEIYKIYLDKLLNNPNNIWTDQVVLSHIHKDLPDIFFKLCHGYGEITKYLY